MVSTVNGDNATAFLLGVLLMAVICLAVFVGGWWLDNREQRQREAKARLQEQVSRRIIAHVSAETDQYCPMCWGTFYPEPDARPVLCDGHRVQPQATQKPQTTQQVAQLNKRVVLELEEILRNAGLA